VARYVRVGDDPAAVGVDEEARTLAGTADIFIEGGVDVGADFDGPLAGIGEDSLGAAAHFCLRHTRCRGDDRESGEQAGDENQNGPTNAARNEAKL